MIKRVDVVIIDEYIFYVEIQFYIISIGKKRAKMKKIGHKILGICLLASLALAGCSNKVSSTSKKEESKKVVYTSFFPITDLAKRIIGDKMEIKQIIQGHEEPHDFELKTKNMAEIAKADLIIYNGAGFENFMKDLKEVAKADNKFVDLSQGLTLLEVNHDHEASSKHDQVNPHTWLSIKNVLKELPSIYEAVKRIDINNAEYYKKNFDKAMAEFKALDEKFSSELAKLPKDKDKYFVVSHSAFNYLADDYGLKQVAVAGISPEEEPSAKQLKTLSDFVKKHHISTIFFEGKATPKVAQTLAKETGTKTDVLYTMEVLNEEEMKMGYIKLMEKNLEALVKSFHD